jgi:hypothetical protein
MNKTQQHRLDMIQATCTFLDAHRSVWTANARVGAAYDKLISIVAGITASHKAFHAGNTKGYTHEEAARLEKATAAVLRLTNVVTEWAIEQGNKWLLERVKCTSSEIDRLRHAESIEKLNALYAVCLAEAAGIPGSTLTDEDFRAARAAIDGYADLRGVKRQVGDARKAERQKIIRLLEDAVPVLKQLDLLIRNYESQQAEFFLQYQQARQILDTGGRKHARTRKAKTTEIPLPAPTVIGKAPGAPSEPPKPGTPDGAGLEEAVA